MAVDGDISLIERARRGDTSAFDSLVRRYQNPAVAYARSLLRNAAASEDAAQEAFVQAWIDLPKLKDAESFGPWLRRIVFKYCDRVRRSSRPSLSLKWALELPSGDDPSGVVERFEDASRVRSAIDALPDALREITFLYYMTGRDVKEIATFLEMAPATVKNRLHAARARLRKELWSMAETVLENDKPSKNEEFAGDVLARVLREFQRQEREDVHTVDRSLLDKGRAALEDAIGQRDAIVAQTAHDGLIVLWRRQQWGTMASMLSRYLTQPLSDSEKAWAYLHLANAIAIDGCAAGAILAHEAFEGWLAGRNPRLSENWPYLPVAEDLVTNVVAGDDLRILFLGQSGEFSTSYFRAWRNDEYLVKVDRALTEIPITPNNRKLCFYLLRMATNACEISGKIAQSQSYIDRMHALAKSAEDENDAAEIMAKALNHQMRLEASKDDGDAFRKAADAAIAFLTDSHTLEIQRGDWLLGERHNLASDLVRKGHYERALPLLEANLSAVGHLGDGYGWVVHAAAVWQTARDRRRTLDLLREASYHSDRDMTSVFEKVGAFSEVMDDPEFLAALSRK